MELIVNEKDGCCESINIEYTPTEALIINHAMRRYSEDEGVDKKGRTIMEQMLDVKPIFVDVTEVEPEPKTGHWREVDINEYACSNCSHCFSIVSEDNSIEEYKYCPNCGCKMESEG